MRHRDSWYDFLPRVGTALVLGILFWFLFFKVPVLYFSLSVGAILGLILFIDWPRFFNITNSTFWLLMPVYPVTPAALIIALNHHPAHRMLLFVAVLLVFSFDFGSYAAGSLFGKHKIAPSISPRKSWEGALGGALFSHITFMLILNAYGNMVPVLTIIGLNIIICTLALCGDMFESFLKRKAGIKDSAHYLPGHGGFLDRLDALLFVIPFFYLFRNYLATLFFGTR